MPKKKTGYLWEIGKPPPVLESHSQAKHKVIDFYLRRYLNVLLANPRREHLRLFLIDGFAGGGLYQSEDGRHELLGSPLVLANAVTETVAEISATRRKPPKVTTDLYLIEKLNPIRTYLRSVLDQHEIDARPGMNVRIMDGTFSDRLPGVLKEISSAGLRKPRAIFLLDQYGYKDVPLADLRKIFASTSGAEVILTFATDALINFMSSDPANRLMLARLELEPLIDAESVEEIKERESATWRSLIQVELHRRLAEQSGATNFTPFFIKSLTSRRSYWLVHLSNHVRARDEMCEVHWSLQNHFSHHAGPGLDMLGFDPVQGVLQQMTFNFDDGAKERSIQTLMEQIPRLPELEDGISWEKLFIQHANQTPATAGMIKEAIHRLERQKDLVVVTPAGGRRRVAAAIEGDDLVVRRRNLILDFSRAA